MAQPVKMLASQGCWQLDFDPQNTQRKERNFSRKQSSDPHVCAVACIDTYRHKYVDTDIQTHRHRHNK